MADAPPNRNSGAAGMVLELVDALRDLGHEVDTVWADELGHRIPHGNLHYLFELPLAYRSVLRRRLQERSYDIVQASQPHGYLAARMLKGMDSAPAFVHVSHGLEPRRVDVMSRWKNVYGSRGNRHGVFRKVLSNFLNLLLRWNDHSIVRWADGHLVGCSQCAEYLSRKMGVDDSKIAVIGCGIPESMRRVERLPMSAKRRSGVLYVGQFAFFKAPNLVAETMNRLATMDRDLRFTWVASAEDHDRIRAMIDERAHPRLRLLDWMSQDDLIEVFDDHGLFLFPSFFEGFGKVFLEAMARGLCVVASDNSGARDVITDRVDGRLVPTGDVDAIVRACIEILEDPVVADRVSRAASRTADRHTWPRIAENVVEFYRRKVLSGSRPNTGVPTS